MLLLLAITWFVTCTVIPCQPWGDAVERLTNIQVELGEFSVLMGTYRALVRPWCRQGGWDRQLLLQQMNHRRWCGCSLVQWGEEAELFWGTGWHLGVALPLAEGTRKGCEMPPVCNPDEQVLLSEKRVFSWNLSEVRLSEQLMEQEVWFPSGSACSIKAALQFLRCGLLADPAAVGACTSLRLPGSGFALWSVLRTLLSARCFKQSASLSSRMFKTWGISEFLYLWPKSTNYRKCFVSCGVSALFLSCWSSTPKSIAADISTSLNLKKTLERSAFEVAKEMFFFSCLEVFAPIRMDVVSIW